MSRIKKFNAGKPGKPGAGEAGEAGEEADGRGQLIARNKCGVFAEIRSAHYVDSIERRSSSRAQTNSNTYKKKNLC